MLTGSDTKDIYKNSNEKTVDGFLSAIEKSKKSQRSNEVFIMDKIQLFGGKVTLNISVEINEIKNKYCIDRDDLNVYIFQDTYENAKTELITQLEYIWKNIVEEDDSNLYNDAKVLKQYLLASSSKIPITKKRISKKEYYLDIARTVSQRSTCLRRQYGCVIVKNDEVISTGYNGSARGEENCCDKGVCWREQNGIPHGEQYEKCVAVHAEQNAIISAARSDMIGATAYLVGFENGVEIEAKPCLICERMLKNAGINKVV